MRVIKTFSPTDANCTATLFEMNGKHILKLEHKNFEQTYKIKQCDLLPLVDFKLQIESLLTPAFMQKVSQRFKQMESDWHGILPTIP